MQVWRSVQVKSAAADELGPASGKNAGERAKRMSVGGIRTVTCAPTYASQYNWEK
jgi:hypothetical protein